MKNEFTDKFMLIENILKIPGVISISDENAEWEYVYEGEGETQTLLLRISIRLGTKKEPPTLGVQVSDSLDLDEKVG